MLMSQQNSSLDELFQKAIAKWHMVDTVEEFEPEFTELLDYIIAHPELRPAAEERFLVGLRFEDTVEWPSDLVCFCMFELRWPRIKQAVEDMFRSGDARYRELYRIVLDAFTDAWPDRHLYSRFLTQT
jgi:hypothetical protein